MRGDNGYDRRDEHEVAEGDRMVGCAYAIAVWPLALAACGGDGPSGPVGRTGNTAPQTTQVGSSTGPAASQTIGAAGGSVTSNDGKLTVTIPAGVLAAATAVTVEPIAAFAPWALGSAYRLGPSGMTFAAPVSIAFHYDPSQLVGTTPELLWIVSQDTTGAWPYASAVTVDTTAHTITVASSHFSDWSIIDGMQIRPPSAEVEPGASVALTLRYCFGGAMGYDCGPADPDAARAPGDDDLPSLPPGLGGIDATSWAVNGDKGGSATYGFVDGSTAGASYVAPSDAPDDRNPVAVSVRLKNANGRTVSTLVSNIKVLGSEPTYHAVGALTRTGEQIAQLILADVTDKLEFDFVVHRDGGMTVSNITNFASTHTNDRIADAEAAGFCRFTVDSPYEFDTFDQFTGAALPTSITLFVGGTATVAGSSYYATVDHACTLALSFPGGDAPVGTFLEVDPRLFANVGSDVVVLGTSPDGLQTDGWVFDIRRTR